MESLFRKPGEPRPKIPRPHPCHKQMCAMLDHVNVDGDEIDGRARRSLVGWLIKWMRGMLAATGPSCVSWTENRRDGP